MGESDVQPEFGIVSVDEGLVRAYNSGEVLQTAGRWLADMPLAEGFAWVRPRKCLPWFQATAEPKSLAERVWDSTILGGGAGDLMEYLVLRNLPDQARAILERARALGVTEEVLNEGAVLAAQGTKPAWKSRYAVGWTAAKLGLLD